MRIIQSANPRPLNLLAVGPGGLVAAASATFGASGEVEVWDARSGEIRFEYRVSVTVPCGLALTPSGRHLLVGEQCRATVFDVATGESGPGPQGELIGFPQFAFRADGRRLLLTEQINGLGTYALFEVTQEAQFRRLWSSALNEVGYRFPAVSPDGLRMAVAVHDDEDDRVKNVVWGVDTENSEVTVRIPFDPASPVQQLAFTADGAKLLVRTDSRTVQMFDATTGAPAGELVHPGRPYVTGVAVHPRGPVACARTNGTVTLWDAEKREQLRTLDWKAGKLVSVAFSPDGALGAAGTEDGKVVVWDVDL